MSVIGRAAPFLMSRALSYDPNTPSSIGGLILWLDADDSATIAQSAGEISAWADKSASALTFSNGAAPNRPTTNASFFDRNCVDFGNSAFTTKWLTSASNLSIPTTSTVFVVWYWDTNPFDGFRYLGLQKGTSSTAISATSGAPYWMIFCTNTEPYDAKAQFVLSGTVGGTTTNTIQAAGTRGLTVYKTPADISLGKIRQNLADQAVGYSAAHTTPAGMQINTIGSTDTTYKPNGAIAEVVIYNSVLSTTDVDTVETYLKAKWGTP